MGGGPRGTPTIVEDRFYALGANGDMGCYELSNGEQLWGGNILQRFNASNIAWGISESILVDGDNVVFTPGGDQAAMVCVDRVSGEIKWRAAVPGNPPAGYSSAIVAEVDGVRQYVNFTHTAVVGVRANDGEFLWANDAAANGTANCSSPLFNDNMVFSSSGYSTGAACVRLTASGRNVSAEQLYHTMDMESHHGGMVEIDGYVYGSDGDVLKCLDMATGEVMWQDRSVGKGAVVYADGKIILRSEGGEVAMFEATPEEYRELGRFMQPDRAERPAWAHPVIAGGRLYLRDWDKLLCFDLRGDEG
jgi:outer membrane protein assembly factor BamB